MPPKTKKKSTAIQARPTAPAPRNRTMGDEIVRIDAVYHVPELAPKAPGP